MPIWLLKVLGYGTYLATALAVINCFVCKDCGGAMACLKIALGGGTVGTIALAAKPLQATGGSVPLTKEAIARASSLPVEVKPVTKVVVKHHAKRKR
jgi:hypothetical protein